MDRSHPFPSHPIPLCIHTYITPYHLTTTTTTTEGDHFYLLQELEIVPHLLFPLMGPASTLDAEEQAGTTPYDTMRHDREGRKEGRQDAAGIALAR